MMSLDQTNGDKTITIKTEPVDPEYEQTEEDNEQSEPAATNSSDASSNISSISSVYPSADSSQRLRGILTNMVKNTDKELTVKNVIEDLLQKNEYLLAQNNAGMFKPQPRNVYKKYDDLVKTISRSGSPSPVSSSAVTGLVKPGEGAILRPGSPTRTCSIPKKDMTHVTQSLTDMSVMETQAEEMFLAMKHEVVCGVASKAFVMTQEGVNIQTDLQFYWCNFCPFKTESKESLLQHVMEHRFHCKTCSYQSFSRGDVIRHAVKEHEDFMDTAKTLKYIILLPDYLQAEVGQNKRKADDDDDDEEESNEAKKQKSNDRKSKEKQKKSSKTDKKSDETGFLDMDVDEIDEDNNYEDTEEEDTQPEEKIIVPRRRNQVAMKSTTPITHPPAATSKPSVNSNITSTINSKTSTSPGQGKSGTVNTVTVSSGLCWNCGYCDFVTLSQTFLKTHLNTQHTGKAHKYVAMLVSSQEEMNKIKEKDAQMYQNPNPALLYGNVNQAAGTHSTLKTVSSPSAVSTLAAVRPTPTLPTTPVSASNTSNNAEEFYEGSDSDEDYIPAEEKKKYPLTYKCAHCNFNAPVCFKIKEHLQMKHTSCVLYSLDMRAVKLKQRRYVFFCHRKNCSFTTKKTDEYLAHSESCTPWLDPACPEKIDLQTRKCLELTRSFSSKISQKAFQMAKNFKATKSAEYACVHCSYTSNNNTRVKKHVLSNHKESDTVMRDLHAHRMKKKMYVYFCKYCLWETRDDSELAGHLKEKHNDSDTLVRDANAVPEFSTFPIAPVTSPLVTSSSVVTENVGSPDPVPYDDSSANTSDTENDNYDDLEVPQDLIQQLMDQYVTDEASRGTSPGRPTRNAAAKAQIRCRAQGQSPQLFRCLHCTHMCFGPNLIKKHIRNRHSSDALRAMDLKKKIARQSANFCFCPKENCPFTSNSEETIINHAISEHDYKREDDHLQRFVLKSIYSSGPSDQQYECLYCTTNTTKSSSEKMRRHIIMEHPGEEVIFRDCIARKLRKTSRVFMCPHMDCSYTTTDQKEYTLHKLAHDKSHIYECARCQWFTANPDSVGSHMSAVHAGEQVTTMEIYLDLDDRGYVVKKVGGTVIKQEPE